jgi:hypothetical protein
MGTILCLKNNKKVFLNGYDINTHTYPDDCPKNTIYDKKIIAYEKRYLNETSAPPVSSNIICFPFSLFPFPFSQKGSVPFSQYAL